MPLIALTGGIASGKSTIARRLGELGAVIVDADRIVREVQAAGSPVLAAIAKEFGAGVLDEHGALDRATLGERVFGDADALGRLNAIVHPAVREESQRQFATAFAADPNAIVVYDVPLLAEARGATEWHLIVVADAPSSMRERRLVELRGLDAAAARARVASQASDAERRAIADVVIDTSGSVEQTLSQVDELWERLAASALEA